MPLQAILPYLPTIISGIGSLLQEDQDPYASQRNQLQSLIQEIRGEFPELERQVRDRGAVSLAGAERSIRDSGATGGMPRNVTEQNVTSMKLGGQRNLEEALNRLSMQKVQTLQNLGSLVGSLPPEQVDNTFQNLLGLSLQDLMGGGPMSQWLGGLGASDAGGTGLNLNSPAVKSAVPGLGTGTQQPFSAQELQSALSAAPAGNTGVGLQLPQVVNKIGKKGGVGLKLPKVGS